MRRLGTGLVLLILLAVPTVAPCGAILSKSYEFKSGVTLLVGAETADGLRLDSVRFRPPSGGKRADPRAGGPLTAEVRVSNNSSVLLKLGIAVALFDAQERLVGVAHGGTTFLPIKPGRQKSYKLVFDDVNRDAHLADLFYISLESKP